MYSVKVEGLKELQADFAYAGRQMAFAHSKALNDLGFLVRTKEMETVPKVFDRPKPQTMKNFFVRKGTKNNPTVTIWFDQIYARGFDEYMTAEVEGGARRMKPSEKRLNRFYVPGLGAKLDAYGNMQGGRVTQILSRLGRFGDVAGYSMNQTAKSKKLSGGKSKTLEYFILTQARGGLKPGVYMRTEKRGAFSSTGAPRAVRGKTGAFQKGLGGMVQARGAIPVMIFTKQPSYKKRFPFYEVAQQTIDANYRRLMHEAIDYALRTAR